MDDRPPLKGAWSASRDLFKFYGPYRIFGTGEATVFKFST